MVEDDGDPLWEDVTMCYKMVIVMNTGLNMGLGKIASQVILVLLRYCLLFSLLTSHPTIRRPVKQLANPLADLFKLKIDDSTIDVL